MQNNLYKKDNRKKKHWLRIKAQAKIYRNYLLYFQSFFLYFFTSFFYYILLQNPFRSAPVVVAIESKRVTFPLQVRHSLDNHFVLFLAKSHTFFLSQLNMCCCSLLLSAFLSLDLFSLCMIFRKWNQLSLTFLRLPLTYWFYYLSVIVDISTHC